MKIYEHGLLMSCLRFNGSLFFIIACTFIDGSKVEMCVFAFAYCSSVVVVMMQLLLLSMYH